MSEILSRFSLDAAKFNVQILLCLLAIWAALSICAIFSINSQSFSNPRRWLWISIVVFIPLLGLLAYLPFSVRREDLPHLWQMRMQKDHKASAANKNSETPKKRAV